MAVEPRSSSDGVNAPLRANAVPLNIPGTYVPAGHHKITLEITDNLRRVGTRTFQFTVLGEIVPQPYRPGSEPLLGD
jgi:hypothetical protein